MLPVLTIKALQNDWNVMRFLKMFTREMLANDVKEGGDKTLVFRKLSSQNFYGRLFKSLN